MPFVIQVAQPDLILASKVARVVELLQIKLVQGSFRFWEEKFGERNRQSKYLHRPIKLSVETSEKAAAARNVVRTLVDFRCLGVRVTGSRKSKVFDSTCKFVVEYSYPGGIEFTPGELRAFAHTNALLNTWPYWREYIQSMAARAGLPPLIAPLLQVRPAAPQPQPPRPRVKLARV